MKKFLPLFAFVFSVFCFSCSNFMDGEVLSGQLEEKIREASSSFKLESITPADQVGGVPKDTPIVVTFSSAVDRSSFENGFTIKSSDGKDLSSHFAGKSEIQYSSGDSVVVISAKGANPIDSNSVSAVVFTLASSVRGANGDALVSAKRSHKYSINSSTDSRAPLIYKLNVAKNKEAAKNGEYFKEGTFAELEEEILPKCEEGKSVCYEVTPYLTGKLYLDYDFYDESSGVKSINFKERLLLKIVSGTEVKNEPVTKSVDISSKGLMGNVKGSLEYDFEPSVGDGVVEISVSVTDFTGHESEAKTFTVIKSTSSSMDRANPFYLENKFMPGDVAFRTRDWWFGSDYEDLNCATFCNDYAGKYLFINGFEHCDYLYYKGIYYGFYPTKWNVSIYEKTSAGKNPLPLSIEDSFYGGSDEYDTTVCVLDISKFSKNESHSLIFEIAEPSGFVYTGEGMIPKVPEFLYAEKKGSNYILHYEVDSSAGVCGHVVVSEDKNLSDVTMGSWSKIKEIENGIVSIPDSYKYFAAFATYNDKVYSTLSSVQPFEVSSSGAGLSVPEYSFVSNGQNSQSYKLTLKIPAGLSGDKIFVAVKTVDGDLDESVCNYIVKKGQESLCVDIATEEYGCEYSFSLNVVSEGAVYSTGFVSLELDESEDNIPPYVETEFDVTGFDIMPYDCTNSLEESRETLDLDESGRGTVTVYYHLYDKKKYTETEILEFPCKVLSFSKHDEKPARFSYEDFAYKQGTYIFYIYLKDKAGNHSVTETDAKYLNDLGAKVFFTKVVKNEKFFVLDMETWDYKTVYLDVAHFQAFNSSVTCESYIFKFFEDKKWKAYAGEKFGVNSETGYADQEVGIELAPLKDKFVSVQSSVQIGTSIPSVYYISDDIFCNLKELNESSGSVGSVVTAVIQHDKPVLVETLYSSINYGENLDDWLRWTDDSHRINVEEYSGNYVDAYNVIGDNAMNPDKSIVPSGCYYTVVCHFADGSAKMIPARCMN